MTQRHKRQDRPFDRDRDRLLAELARCRKTCIEIQIQLKPSSATYKSASMVLASISQLAETLTGDPDYFGASISPAPSQRAE